MIRPGPRLPGALGAVALFGLLVPLEPRLAWVVAAGVALAALAAAAEALALQRMVLSVERAPALVVPLGATEDVVLRLRADGDRAVHLRARQLWPDVLDPRAGSGRGLCRPGEVLPIRLEVQGARRGAAALPAPHVAATFVGLAERVVEAGAPAEVTVVPDLRAVARAHATLNRYALRGLGSRASARLGKGRDFDRLRDYVAGDELRDMAWKASARHGKLIVREYRLDRTQDVLVCLDRGHRMAARVAGLSKLDHAVNAALLLAYISNRMEDRTALLWFAAEVEHGVPPGRGGRHLRLFTARAAGVQASRVHTDYLGLVAAVRSRVRHRTLLAVFTALPEVDQQPLLTAVRMLAPQHLPLVMVLTDPDLAAAAQMLPASRAELARTLVAQEVVAGRQQTVLQLRRLGALVVETAPRDAGVAAMNAYVDVKRRQLL